ncbi:MAG: hypothetical protein E6H81_02720 [Chloroflexi bacterium]|nr:MAG: hypothetical protein E6H81_02720 [Chloroflexota bacterium]
MDTWTVLLIGGPAATRKTSVAKTIAARCGTEVLQADDVWLALQRAIDPDTRPTLHFFARETVWDRPIEELVTAMRVLADEVSAALEPVTAHHLRVRDRIVIEGVWITPAFAARKAFGGSTYDGAVRSVFIDERDQTAIRDVMLARGRGIQEWLPRRQTAMVRMQAGYGEWLREAASAQGLPLVAARPVETLVDRVLTAVN